MHRKNALWAAVVLLGLALPAVAQQNSAPAAQNTAPRGTPCWQQAGVPQDVMDKIKGIRAKGHADVQAVCADTSLSDAQKRDKAREIRNSTHEQVMALLTPEQRKAVNQCREERGNGAGRGAHRGGHGGRGNPCANVR